MLKCTVFSETACNGSSRRVLEIFVLCGKARLRSYQAFTHMGILEIQLPRMLGNTDTALWRFFVELRVPHNCLLHKFSSRLLHLRSSFSMCFVMLSVCCSSSWSSSLGMPLTVRSIWSIVWSSSSTRFPEASESETPPILFNVLTWTNTTLWRGWV